MQLDLQIPSLSSEKFGTMILGEEVHLTSACRLGVSSLISPPPTPAMAVATTAVVSYPPAGWGGHAAPFWAVEAVEYLPCLR
jgi:hypothetical protein